MQRPAPISIRTHGDAGRRRPSTTRIGRILDTTVADEVTGAHAVEKHTVAGEKPALPAAYQGLGYHELNAMLDLYGPNGEIQFEADREAAHQYFLQHVTNNT